MPTGYTYSVAEGDVTELKPFALQCARAFGALVTMRDEPMDAPIPERFEPNHAYYADALKAAQAIVAELPTLSAEECEQRAESEYREAVARRDKYIAEKRTQRHRYEAMLAKVEAWECPAEGLKPFMLEQLRTSISHDCNEDMRLYPAPKRQAGEDWRRAKLDEAIEKVARYSGEIAKENARVAERNRWLADLRASLEPHTLPTEDAIAAETMEKQP